MATVTEFPSLAPSASPSVSASDRPSMHPSGRPSSSPSYEPSPSTSANPTFIRSIDPTYMTSAPSIYSSTNVPSAAPSMLPATNIVLIVFVSFGGAVTLLALATCMFVFIRGNNRSKTVKEVMLSPGAAGEASDAENQFDLASDDQEEEKTELKMGTDHEFLNSLLNEDGKFDLSTPVSQARGQAPLSILSGSIDDDDDYNSSGFDSSTNLDTSVIDNDDLSLDDEENTNRSVGDITGVSLDFETK